MTFDHHKESESGTMESCSPNVNMITIENCRNIVSGLVPIHEKKLTILHGSNGVGKSTIARAIEDYAAKLPIFIDLAPCLESIFDGTYPTFPSTGQEEEKKVEEQPIPSVKSSSNVGHVMVFNEDYVREFLFKKESLIAQTFEVFATSEKTEKKKLLLSENMTTLWNFFERRIDIKRFWEDIRKLFDALRPIADDMEKLTKSLNSVAIILESSGNSNERRIHKRAVLQNDGTVKWAGGKLEAGHDEPGLPLATAINNLWPYINRQRVLNLLEVTCCDGIVKRTEIEKLLNETQYLIEKIDSLIKLQGLPNSSQHGISAHEEIAELKIEADQCDAFFSDSYIGEIISGVNGAVDEVLRNVDKFLPAKKQYGSALWDALKARQDDINNFLKLAGFRYQFKIESEKDGEARAFLTFAGPKGEETSHKSHGWTLSQAEKNALALILFMFDAIRRKPYAIILDDPISSFDGDKKYAVLNRLFNRKAYDSLNGQTVLFLTHDLEPLVDIFLKPSASMPEHGQVFAYHLENKFGQLQCQSISEPNHFLPWPALMMDIASDSQVNIFSRLASLRKFTDMVKLKDKVAEHAYDILSSLLHGRDLPSKVIKNPDGKRRPEPLNERDISDGLSFIFKFIGNHDSYASLLAAVSTERIFELYEENGLKPYFKTQLFRAYSMRCRDFRDNLSKESDILRKYADETYHIEKDYLYSLDLRHYDLVPPEHIELIDTFMASEKTKYLTNHLNGAVAYNK